MGFNELKPCPRCNGRARLRFIEDVYLSRKTFGYAVVCTGCGFATPSTDNISRALNDWNEIASQDLRLRRANDET